jgi:hypothetical protein
MVPNVTFKELPLTVIISQKYTAKRSSSVSTAEVKVEPVLTQWLTIQDRNFINKEQKKSSYNTINASTVIGTM